MKNEKISMKQALSLHVWAAKVWWRENPKLYLTTILHAALAALSPYVTVWLSAQLIDALSAHRGSEELWKWATLTVGITALLQLLTAALAHWRATEHSTDYYVESRMQMEKMMDMDFAAVEDPKTDALRWALRRHALGNVYGFIKIHTYYAEGVVKGLVSIIGATALTVSLFTQRVPSSAGTLAVLNHPLVTVASLLLLLLGIAIPPVLEAQVSKEQTKIMPYSNLGNRVLSTYAWFGTEKRALDVRMYRQDRIAVQALRDTALCRKGAPAVRIYCWDVARWAVVYKVVRVALTGGIYVFVCLKALAGAFGIGSVTQYVGAITQLCASLGDLLEFLGQLSFNALYVQDEKAFLEIPNDMYQGSLPTEKRDDREYEVEFRDVSFRYPRSETYALRHVNMKFKIGSRLAIVGMNGSGKTTFIKLLCRLYDPTEGQILLNGIDIRKYAYNDYMNIFSVVFQDFSLMALPLGENVAASADYDRARAEQCLRRAGFGERLDAMPDGLDTYLYKELSESGVTVSGGEAQKIAIARALYKDAPFIILDEPTAALDPIAEAEIYSKFSDIAGDKTTIYISHRLSSCVFCDEIAVFHDGAVIQQGTHAELLAQVDGKYRELWNAQAQYYTET